MIVSGERAEPIWTVDPSGRPIHPGDVSPSAARDPKMHVAVIPSDDLGHQEHVCVVAKQVVFTNVPFPLATASLGESVHGRPTRNPRSLQGRR